MSSNHGAAPTDRIAFAPIPLASGSQFIGDDGEAYDVADVSVLLTGPDGTQKRVPLEWRFGGWWPPTD